MLAFDMARATQGRFLVRIENIDQMRSRASWEAQIYEDLAWLGLTWEKPVLRQSDRIDAYVNALDTLWSMGVLYPCYCSRRDIAAAASAPQEGAPMRGLDGLIYPGTCRNRPDRPLPTSPRPKSVALRIDMKAALDALGEADVSHVETGNSNINTYKTITSRDMLNQIGDVVLSRKDFLGSYHLSVVLDDAAQNVTHVVRGEDLVDATPIHVVLQRLLRLNTPIYHHHRLIRDDNEKRLAKRDNARALRKLREDGLSPGDVREMLGLGAIPSSAS